MRFVVALAVVLTGCSGSIRVVDQDGKPIRDALVLTYQWPYILQPERVGASLTNENGVAGGLPSRTDAWVIKPGFHVVTLKDRGGPVTLKPIRTPGNCQVRDVNGTWGWIPSNGGYPVEHSLGHGLVITARSLDFHPSLHVSSPGGFVAASPDFYWDRTSIEDLVRKAVREVEVGFGEAFFVLDADRQPVLKVGLSSISRNQNGNAVAVYGRFYAAVLTPDTLWLEPPLEVGGITRWIELAREPGTYEGQLESREARKIALKYLDSLRETTAPESHR